MNTESQNSTATFLAHAVDSDLGELAGTSRLFVKRFDRVSDDQWNAMREWCGDNLYHGGHYEPHWCAIWPSFYFHDEREYTLFLLRWA